jgi:HK97 family phage portal protein
MYDDRVWTWAERVVNRLAGRWATRNSYSVSDPNLLSYFGYPGPSDSGETVTESSALGLSAVYRAVSLIAGTVGTITLRSLRDTGDGMRQRVSSFLDTPGGPDSLCGMTAYEWKETVVAHLLLGGDAFLAHVRAGGGQLIGLVPIHPLCVTVEWAKTWPESDRPVIGGKLFTVNLEDGTRQQFDASTMTHIPGLSLDGLRGMSIISLARNSLGTAQAGERASGRMFANGSMLSGIVTPEDDLDETEAEAAGRDVNNRMAGVGNVGRIAVLTRRLKFTPMSMSAADAQFLQSRQFSIEEVARWFGVPPHLLMQTDKQTSWGTGVDEQNRGLSRYVLNQWTTRMEQRLSRLLSNPIFCEFDFAALERPDAAEEIDLLIKQVDSGLLTLNEARAIRNMPPVDGGDEVRGSTPPAIEAPADQEAVPA